MSIWFIARAAVSIMKARPGSVVRVFLVSAFGTLWCVGGACVALGVWRDLDRRAADVRVDVVLADSVTSEDAVRLLKKIRIDAAVASAQLLSADAVWSSFSKGLGINASTLREVTAVPAIIRVQIPAGSINPAEVSGLEERIKTYGNDTVLDVAWSALFVSQIESERRNLSIFVVLSGALSLILFAVSVSYSFRAEVHRASRDLAVERLLGAASWWTAMPHVLVAIVAGLIGLAVAIGCIAVTLRTIERAYSWVTVVNTGELALMALSLVLLGVCLAWMQTLLFVRSRGWNE